VCCGLAGRGDPEWGCRWPTNGIRYFPHTNISPTSPPPRRWDEKNPLSPIIQPTYFHTIDSPLHPSLNSSKNSDSCYSETYRRGYPPKNLKKYKKLGSTFTWIHIWGCRGQGKNPFMVSFGKNEKYDFRLSEHFPVTMKLYPSTMFPNFTKL
jgi:hypothetical protein